jgi:MIP family channel proteins
MNKILKQMASEFLGTFVIILMGCGAIMIHALNPEAITSFLIPIIFGVVVSVMVYTLSHISGAHFNPAVTLALSSIGSFPWRHIPFYWASQIIGASAAIAILSYYLPGVADYGMTKTILSCHQAFTVEVILTFLLMLVVMGTTDAQAHGNMAGLAIGGIVMLDAFVGGLFTGASMNPARSIAPALFANKLGQLWIYILAPSVGAVMAALFYKNFLGKTKNI